MMIKKIHDRFSSIHNKLPIGIKINLLIIASSFTVLVILAFFSNWFSSRMLIDKTIQSSLQTLDLVAQKVDIVMDNAENYSKIALTNDTVQNTLKTDFPSASEDGFSTYSNLISIRNALTNIIEPKTFIDGIIIYGRNNKIFPSFDMQLDKDSLPQDILSIADAYSHAHWVDTHKSIYKKDNKSRNVFSLCKPLINADTGSIMGMLEMCINENYISGLYSGLRIGNTGSVFIINPQGQIVSHTAKDMLYKSISGEPYFLSGVKHNQSSILFYSGHQQYLAVFKSYMRLNWTIVGIAPVSEITKDNTILMKKILFIGILCIALAVLFSSAISRTLTRPIAELTRVAKSVGEGDLEAYVDIKSEDEIGILSSEFNKMVHRTSELLNKVYTEQKKKREYELAMLQAQVNPHFLYNTLESISSLAELERKDEVVETVNSLAAFYRGVLSKGTSIIPIKDEVKNIEYYLKILKIRYGKDLQYRIEVSDDVYKYNTVKMILQPLVENSIHHGLKSKKGKGNILVKGLVDGDKVCFYIIDDGTGMNEEDIKRVFTDSGNNYKTLSFGLRATNDRIKLYYGPEYGIEIESTYGEGTIVRVTLPAKQIEGGM